MEKLTLNQLIKMSETLKKYIAAEEKRSSAILEKIKGR